MPAEGVNESCMSEHGKGRRRRRLAGQLEKLAVGGPDGGSVFL